MVRLAGFEPATFSPTVRCSKTRNGDAGSGTVQQDHPYSPAFVIEAAADPNVSQPGFRAQIIDMPKDRIGPPEMTPQPSVQVSFRTTHIDERTGIQIGRGQPPGFKPYENRKFEAQQIEPSLERWEE